MNRHWGSPASGTLQIVRIIKRSKVLGPGLRTVVVVQGCELRCKSCSAPHTHRLDGGHSVAVADLANDLCVADAVTGITFTGGEPFLQSAALSSPPTRKSSSHSPSDQLPGLANHCSFKAGSAKALNAWAGVCG